MTPQSPDKKPAPEGVQQQFPEKVWVAFSNNPKRSKYMCIDEEGYESLPDPEPFDAKPYVPESLLTQARRESRAAAFEEAAKELALASLAIKGAAYNPVRAVTKWLDAQAKAERRTP